MSLGSTGINAFSFFFGLYLVAWLGGSLVLLGMANASATIMGWPPRCWQDTPATGWAAVNPFYWPDMPGTPSSGLDSQL